MKLPQNLLTAACAGLALTALTVACEKEALPAERCDQECTENGCTDPQLHAAPITYDNCPGCGMG